ncbi:NACHT domain-containing protein [Streptomyces sp. RG80]|uniref:NACHT domain-containing protein n=1 Tax=Streptomyces sp. RG80 TaxID=3157340 RepID=UPI0033901554
MVELWSGVPGSGYLVGPRAILTARHAVASGPAADGEIRLRLLTPAGAAVPRGWSRGHVLWESEELDAALVVAGIDAVPRSVPEVAWGRLEDPWPLPCTAVGFPERARVGGTRDADQLEGVIVPVAQHKQGRIAVDVRGAGQGGTDSWGGFSGAGLFAVDRLIGVVSALASSPSYGGRRLHAVPVTALWDDQGFRAAARELGLSGAMTAVVPVRPSAPPGDFGPSAVPPPWRLSMLDVVDRHWIKGSLERSFQETVQLDVACSRVPDLEPDPWEQDDGWDSGAPQPAAPLTVDQVVAECLVPPSGKRMLIVGEPGSGKTALLLGIAERLHGYALQDPREPLPVPLLLQNWRDPKEPFAAWAAQEIARRYGVPQPQAAKWLAGGALFLLADGLDEIPAGSREQCRAALAAFLADPSYAQVGMVLTSRETEYRDGPPLPVTAAVRIEPLSRQAILDRLAEAPGDYRTLSQAVATDDTLAELLTTPLMLGVATATLRDIDPENAHVLPHGSSDERRRQLYRRYLEHLLRRPRALRPRVSTGSARATLAAVRHLVPLARMMQTRNEAVFLPDWITPEWNAAGYAARSPWQPGIRHRAGTLAAMLIAPALFALVGMPLFTGAGVLAHRGTDIAVLTAAAGTLAFALGRGFQVVPERAWAKWRWYWAAASGGALIGAVIALGVCLVSSMTLGSVSDTPLVLYAVWGLGSAVVVAITLALKSDWESIDLLHRAPALVTGALVGIETGGVQSPWNDAFSYEGLLENRDEPGLFETLGHVIVHFPDPFFDGTNVGLVAGILGAIAGGWAGGVAFGFTYGLMGAVPGGLSMCITFALVSGLVPDEEAVPSAPSQALRASAKVASRLCLGFAAIALAVLVVTAGLDGPAAQVGALLLVAFALLVGSGPGRTWLAYWSTRWELAARRVLPWQLRTFLSDASERALLTRTGGGFRFLHVSFRDYVAGLGEDAVTRTGKLTDQADPAWSVQAVHPTSSAGGSAADLAVLRAWWQESSTGALVAALGRALGHGLLRLLPSVGGGYLLTSIITLLFGIGDDSFWLLMLLCTPIAGAIHLAVRFGLPARLGVQPRDVGQRFKGWLSSLDAQYPVLYPTAVRTLLGAFVGYVLGGVVAELTGSGPSTGDILGYLLAGMGAAAALLLSLRRRNTRHR